MKPTYILGISAFYHDSAACLVKNGEIIAAAQEERFTRKKHDESFPKNAINFCLKEAGIAVDDLSFVGYYEKPFIKFERLLFTYLSRGPFGLNSFLKAMPVWLNQKLFLKDFIAEELQYKGEILFVEHHESHAASAFYPSPFQEAAIMTIDGVGEWTTSSLGVGSGNEMDINYEIKFPHSLGLLYSAFTYYVGFRVNSGEYKLMGLAPYGQPKYVDLIKKELIDIKEDGSFKLNMRYFDYCTGLTMTNHRFDRLFGGPPRRPESKITQRDMDIARSIQEVTEEIMVKMAKHAYEISGKDNLCLAGGVALNCVGNGKILKHTRFKNIWIQPAAGDAGGALGAALFIWYKYLGNNRQADNVQDFQKGSFLGPRYSENEIEDFLIKSKICYEKISKDDLPRKVAELIQAQKIVGFFQGSMEFGPRALGARSIIADAQSIEMQSAINLKTKFRESFRPFAPSVLKEESKRFFEIDGESPYMLLVSPLRTNKRLPLPVDYDQKDLLDKLKVERSVIPAVTHVDGSARVQTVKEETNPVFYKTIQEFYKVTECPVVINTSFNIRGEPIVCTPQDAYRCFMCTNMDFLVLENFLIDRTLQSNQHLYKKEDISQILD